MASQSTDKLREAAFSCVAECRQNLKEGRSDLSGLERSVRDYCVAIAALPKEEGVAQEAHLKALMQEVERLSQELARMQEAIRQELAGLGRIQQANVAYHKSYTVAPVPIPKDEED